MKRFSFWLPARRRWMPGCMSNPGSRRPARLVQRLAARRQPALHLFVTLRIAVKGALEISQGNDETGPAVPVAVLEQVMLDERPQSVPERTAIETRFDASFGAPSEE